MLSTAAFNMIKRESRMFALSTTNTCPAIRSQHLDPQFLFSGL